MNVVEQKINTAQQAMMQLKQQVQQAVVGQEEVIQGLIIALLCSGNVLLEGLPGTAKTRCITALAKSLDASLGRIQFTPDLLPSDVTGSEVYHVDAGNDRLTFAPGPVFNNLVLADEINRAPAKVQSALLEAMQEAQVTVAGKTYPMAELFMVLATQNPIEQEGTYPLPEAQLDRFLIKLSLDYPDQTNELAIMRLVRSEEDASEVVLPNIAQSQLFEARRQVHQLPISEAVEHYIVALVMATRDAAKYSSDLAGWISVGASPRASIALDRCARANAWLEGRAYVSPEDVRAVVSQVLAHRIVVSYQAQAQGIDARFIVSEILQLVAVV